jgi:hypothetical protein
MITIRPQQYPTTYVNGHFRVASVARREGYRKSDWHHELTLKDRSRYLDAVASKAQRLAPGQSVWAFGCILSRGGSPVLVICSATIVARSEQLSLFSGF